MRLIDADALKLSDFQDYSNTDVICAIDNAPTIDPWVSVEDELPTHEYVLLCVKTLRFGKRTTFGRMTGNGKFTYKKAEWEDKVTHWMPLPEPPNC